MSYPHPMDDKTGFEATDAEMGLPAFADCDACGDSVPLDQLSICEFPEFEGFVCEPCKRDTLICKACDGIGEVGTGRMSHSVNSATIDPPWEITECCPECSSALNHR